MNGEEIPDFLREHAVSLLEYQPCKWTGCGKEVHYAMGPGAGYCHEHGLVKIRANQASGVERKKALRAAAPDPLAPLARDIVAKAKAFDQAALKAHKAEARRRDALAELRVSIRALITATADQAPAQA